MNKPQRLPLEEFKSIYARVPRLTVEAILIEDNKVLLTKRAIGPEEGRWHTPGGTVLMGEMLEDTARRVVKEELGIDSKVIRPLDHIEYYTFKTFGKDVSICFQMARTDNTPITLDNTASEYNFFETIPKDTIPEQADFLRKILKLQ